MYRSARTKHTYRTQLYEFIKDILVICPNRSDKAIVKTGNFQTMKFEIQEVRVVCIQCTYFKTLDRVPMKGKQLIFGAPVDPFFHLPVWFQATFEGELLWAYNADHLDFLADHVGAKLRERNGFKFNVKSIGARLPRWMTSKRNRDEILKVIHHLKSRA